MAGVGHINGSVSYDGAENEAEIFFIFLCTNF